MVYEKAKTEYGRHYPRKDRRVADWGITYKTWFHYDNGYNAKIFRKIANRKLRRYKGDVSNNGWYKKFEDVWWNLF